MRTSQFPATRWSLIRSLGTGSDLAIQELLQHYAPAIEIYIRRRLSNEAPLGIMDDIVQDVLLDLFKRQDVLARAQSGEKSHFRYLLMRVAYNAARNARRRLQRGNQQTVVHLDDDSIAGFLELERDLNLEEQQSMDRAWGLSVVEQAIADCLAWSVDCSVDQESLTALSLELDEGLNQRDIAERMSLSLATAHRRLARGRMMIRKAMVDHLMASGECVVGGEEETLLHIWDAVTQKS